MVLQDASDGSFWECILAHRGYAGIDKKIAEEKSLA